MSIASDARRTKAELERRGTVIETLIDYRIGKPAEDCPVCIMGGVGAAIQGDPELGDLFAPAMFLVGEVDGEDTPLGTSPEQDALLQAIADEIEGKPVDARCVVGTIYEWFDGEIEGDLGKALELLDRVIAKHPDNNESEVG